MKKTAIEEFTIDIIFYIPYCLADRETMALVSTSSPSVKFKCRQCGRILPFMLPHSLADYSDYCNNYGKEYDEVMMDNKNS